MSGKPRAARVRQLVERDIERAHVAAVEADGGMSIKIVSPNFTGIPDRLDLRPIPIEHREIVARYVTASEIKRPNGPKRARQIYVAEQLRALGFTVNFIDDFPT